MMRSLYSGVSGLRVHQTKMDVIGNNISNVNTVGFKASYVNFSDVFYQTTQSASGANLQTGKTGQNAKQIGLGSTVSSITKSVATPGGSQRTDNALDVMITGDSFFVVNSGGANYFTRNGAFKVDNNGTLCTEFGASVMGWQVDPDDETKTIKDSVTPLQVMSAENTYATPEATTQAYVKGNVDKKDTQLDKKDGVTFMIEMFDNMGNKFNIQMYVKRGEDEEASNIYSVGIKDIKDTNNESIFVKKIVEDGVTTYTASGITEVTLGEGTFTAGEIDEKTGELTLEGEGQALTFDSITGKFVSIGQEATEDNPATSLAFNVVTDPNPFSEINIDFSQMTQFSTSDKCTVEGRKGNADGAGAGRKVGSLSGLEVDVAGKIFGKYNNGMVRLLGQIAVASFANPVGLESIGSTMYGVTQNSGDFDGIGQDITQVGGEMQTGVLEMSNVDLAAQFTDMITTQRGFQANSRIITTSDTLLEELLNLKR